jgi:hypothetical protein
MSDQIVENAIGTIDGSNTDFTTSVEYVPTTVRIIYNGMMLDYSDPVDGVTELGTNSVRTNFTPLIGDTIQFWYHTTAGTSLFGSYNPPEPYAAIDLVPTPYGATVED